MANKCFLCGSEVKKVKEPCFFCEDGISCNFCDEDGMVTVLYCTNKDCEGYDDEIMGGGEK